MPNRDATQDVLLHRLQRATQACGGGTAAIGAVALIGWLTEWRNLASIRPDYIPMAPNTALAFVTLGGTLCALTGAGRWRYRSARAGAALVMVVVVLRLVEYITGADLGVDRWIFRVPGETLGLAPVGRMAFFTTVNFAFSSAALFLLASPARRRLVKGLAGGMAVVVTFTGLAFALGYLYGAPLFYGGEKVPMALNTAVSFVGLGAGLVLVSIADDAVGRRRAEEALRASEERYRILFETMDEGFCEIEMLFDTTGKADDYRFVSINPAFEKHTGLQQALGRTMRQMVPNHDEHWFEIYGKVAQTGEAIRFQNPADAMQRYYDVFAFRIGGEGSRKVGILFSDITGRKRAEESLRRAHD